MKKLLLILISLTIALPAWAGDAARYRDCVDQALNNPVETFVIASAWKDEGGGVAAEHCIALVLSALERYEPAARQLELVAEHMEAGIGVDPFTMNITPELRAGLLAQAGNAWLLAERGGEAHAAFSKALEVLGAESASALEILIDRARAAALIGDMEAVVEDLDRAQIMAPMRGDIYLYRAAAKRKLDDLPAAKSDIGNALKNGLDDADTHLEAGNIAAALGDLDQARTHWLTTVERASEGPAVDAARANLAELDINPTP